MSVSGSRMMRYGFAALIGVGAGALASAQADDAVPVPQAAVQALNRVSGGPHPGFRANHAKGVMLTGHFTASKDAATITKAAHLQGGGSIPALVRFSDATGIPNIPDADPGTSIHGMAIRFQLPNQVNTDIVAINATSFVVATPQDFVALNNAIADTKGVTTHPTPIEAFLKTHPKTLAWVQTPRPAPESFSTVAFYGLNAFKFTNAAGKSQFGRYQILPLAGEHALTDAQVKTALPNYLMDDIQKRVKETPVKFRLMLQLAGPGDALNDPTVMWPANRTVMELGTITIDGVVKDQVGEQKKIMFNPLALVPGIDPSDDPVLAVRPAAYAISYAQRLN
jgi:catalase